MSESSNPISIRSTSRPDTFATQKIRPVESRITFSDLAEFALGSKTAAALHEKTDADIRTCRRWLSEESKPPPNVIYLLFAEIARRAAL